MPLFDKFRQLAETRQVLLSGGRADPFNVVVDQVISSTEAMVNGRRTILAGTNNYLGLTFHPDCIDAARTALENAGLIQNARYIERATMTAERSMPLADMTDATAPYFSMVLVRRRDGVS